MDMVLPILIFFLRAPAVNIAPCCPVVRFTPLVRPALGHTYARRALSAARHLALGASGTWTPFWTPAGHMSCSLVPEPGVPVDGYLFGLNSVLGPIVPLPYDDPELVAAGRALGAGTIRWPGGAVANFWSIRDCNFVASQGETFKKRYDTVDQLPVGTFSPLNFWNGVGSAALGTRPPVWVLNVHTLDGDEMLAQVDLLHEQARHPA